MRANIIFAVCLMVLLQVSFSTQTPLRRQMRQADDDAIGFPDNGETPNLEDRWSGSRRPNRRWPNQQWPGAQRPASNNGQNGQNRPEWNQGENRPEWNQGQNGPQRPGRPDQNQIPEGGRPSNQQQQPASSTAAPTPAPANNAPSADCVRRCLVTPEYNPVCGSTGGDGRQGFTNRSRLECNRTCGQNIQFLRMGNC